MGGDKKEEPTQAVREIVEAMVSKALARCDHLGISHHDFYHAMLEEQKVRSKGDLPDLLERTFRRLRGAAN